MSCIVVNQDSVLTDGNRILGTFPSLKNARIEFFGSGNILFCEKNVSLGNSKLSFRGDNSVIYLSSSRHMYYLNASAFHNPTIFFGEENYFNGVMNVLAAEQKNVVIGAFGLFSFGIWIRTTDSHMMYDALSHCRINYGHSVFIGDHVWIGQGAMILPGCSVGSGSIIGAMSVVAGKKKLPSNSCWAGSPARMIRKNVFWTGDCVHFYQNEQTEKMSSHSTDAFIFHKDTASGEAYQECENILKEPRPDIRTDKLRALLREGKSKNRFFLPEDT